MRVKALFFPFRASRAFLWAPLWLLAGGVGGFSGAGEARPKVTIAPEELTRDAVPLEGVKRHVAALAQLPTRVAGSEGCRQARQYIIDTLQSLGYRDGTGKDAYRPDDALAATPLAKNIMAAMAPAKSHVPLIGTIVGIALILFALLWFLLKWKACGVVSGAGLVLGTAILLYVHVWYQPPLPAPKDKAIGEQRFSKIKPGTHLPRNIRITITDPDNSLEGGTIVLEGLGLDQKKLTEELKVPASGRGQAEISGDRPFLKLTSITAKGFLGTLTPGADRLSAGWGVRYYIGTQRFWGVSPIERGGGRLTFTQEPPAEGRPVSYPLYAVWPNGTAITSTGRSGVEGPLIYAGTGRQQEFDGLPVHDALVLLDLDEDTKWTLAAGLGARAVIFIEPKVALRPVMEKLYLASPVEFPRLWMPRKEGLALRARIKAANAKGRFPKARARIKMSWKRELWENIYLLIPGSKRFAPLSTELSEADRKKAQRELDGATIVLSAYYDSNAIVPALAPGAEQALSCAALLELAKQYRTRPPARDVLLLFCSGHFQALKGEREFFAEVEYDAKELPYSVSRKDLAEQRGKETIHAALLKQLLSGKTDLLKRAQWVPLAQQAAQAYRESPQGAEDLAIQEEATERVSTWALVIGIFLGLLSVIWWRRKWPAPLLIAFLCGLASLTTLLYGVLEPKLLQGDSPWEKTVDAQERMDGLLDRWKQETNIIETEKERESRLLRYEGLSDPADKKKYETLFQERLDYERAGRVLYALSSTGLGVEFPEHSEQYLPILRKSAGVLQARLAKELTWIRREYGRRAANRPFRDLVQARLARACGRKSLFLSLDLSAGNPGLGLFYMGSFYGRYGDIESRYKTFGRSVMEIATAVEKAAGAVKEGTLIPDTLLEKQGRNWSTYQGTGLALAAEIAVQAQVRGLTLATPYDRRMDWDTPQDDGRRLRWENVESQLKLIGTLLRRFLAAPAVTSESRFDKGLKYTGLSQTIFTTVRRGGARSIFPNIPVSDAVIQNVLWMNGNAAGVRLNMREATSPVGKARMVGPRHGGYYRYEVNVCDPESGEITYALNKEKHKLNENDSFGRKVGVRTRRDTLELFRAQGLAVLDVVDPGRLRVLRNCSLLAGQTESRPLEFGTSHNYAHEPYRVLFAEPGSRIKCLFREGEFGLRLAILDVKDSVYRRLLDPQSAKKVTKEEARGRGFKLGAHKILQWLPKRTASDLWCLGEKRLQNLREHSIGNAKLDNPDFPGPNSLGRVSVEKGRRLVKRSAAPEGAAWGPEVAGKPFRVLSTPEVYRVAALKGPNELLLEKPYGYPSVSGAEFILTKEKPGLHNLTKMRLSEAHAAEQAGHYGKAWRLYTDAWGLEARAYPEVLGTAHDSLMGVVFYLFLLLPFCFFLERLLFAFPRIEHQIGAFFTIFTLMFVLLWLVHPAFSLVAAPPVILLAFVTMSLSGIVIAIIYGKFNTEMRLMQQGMHGFQSADINRASAALVAVSLGISQMRRRKFRTFLTCLTVVLLTFTALSFTSTVRTIAQAHIDLSPGNDKDAPYEGLMLRQLNYDTLSFEAFDQMQRELATEGIACAPRFWRVAKKNEKIYIDVQAEGKTLGEGGRKNDRIASPSCMMGLSAQEAVLFPRLKKKVRDGGVLLAGSWLEEGDRDVCLIPSTLLNQLRPKNIAKEDWNAEKALGMTLELGGHAVRVRGVYLPEEFDTLKDLDDEALTPADFSASEASRGAQQQTDPTAQLANLENAKSAKYEHISAGDSIVLPWQTARLLGADLRSVAARIGGADHVKVLDRLVGRILKRVEKNLFVGRKGRRQLYASTGKLSLTGLGNLVVPLLIAVLILLNTMIGAVYERNREITIFSSLGLAPSHVAALFLAEAMVYAVLGAIFGYVLGQGVAKFVQYFGEHLGIVGLYLNYSSSSAVFVTAIVMAAVIGSTLYPAVMAAKAASPSEERRWGVPMPVGDEISLELPFSFQAYIVPGAALFLHEFFESHAESSLGKFTAKEVTLEAFHTDRGQGLCLFFMAWLTPYDLGVSQEVQIYIVPSGDEGLYVTEATFYRVSGYVNSWRRVNLPFLNALRKHLLLWRTYSPEQRQDFAVRGFYQFRDAFEAVGWPAPEGVRPPQDYEAPELAEQGAVIGGPSSEEEAAGRSEADAPDAAAADV